MSAPARKNISTSAYPGRKGSAKRILIVDDDQINRLVLSNLLKKSNYEVMEAVNGAEAITLFQQFQPDAILMDVMMPVMDGYEATQHIKAIAGNHFVPVLFLTALTNEAALAKCVESGGDDFMTKPYSRAILQMKLNAALRVKSLYSELEQYTRTVEQHNDHMRLEQEAAERIFNRIVSRGHLLHDCFRHRLSAAALFNGDILLARQLEDGGYRVMLGDFTGHGLAASVGAIPISEMFYTMTAKAIPLSELVREINRKLHTILPTDVFLSACIMDVYTDRIEVWNGGIPDVMMYGVSGEIQRVTSTYLPVGILPDAEFKSDTTRIDIASPSRIYIYSDGVTEATNDKGEQFGEERFLDIMQKYGSVGNVIESLWKSIEYHTQTSGQQDDMTIIEIDTQKIK